MKSAPQNIATSMAELIFSYNGNQRTGVDDYASWAETFYGNEGIIYRENTDEITRRYDANGNATFDLNSDVYGIRYNLLNLPDTIQFNMGHQTAYTYSASGAKLRVTDKTAAPNVNVPFPTTVGQVLKTVPTATATVTDYAGNMVYENGVLKKILTPTGYYNTGDKLYYYFLKDHLGSNRVVMNQNGGIVERNHYYPSGQRFGESIVAGGSVQPYRHTGHEMLAMHGLNWIDNGARFRTVYDGGSFTTRDPLAEKYYSISPYVYCLNNPMRLIDIDGKDPGDPFKTLYEAAKDYGRHYNDNSIVEKREYAATIYQYKNMFGETRYSYSEPSQGTYDSSRPSGSGITRTDVAIIHSHANYDSKYDSNNFSPDDKKLSQKKDMPIFVTTPDGSLKQYDPKSNKPTTVSTDMPSDQNDPKHLNNIDARSKELPKNEPTRNLWHWIRDNILVPLGEGAQAVKNSN
jgi:RHS repeat-associated protein